MQIPFRESNLPVQEIIHKANLRNMYIAEGTGLCLRTIDRAMGGKPVSKKTKDKIRSYFKSKAMEYIKTTT